MKPYIRNLSKSCPQCSQIVTYSNVSKLNRSIRSNSVCFTCHMNNKNKNSMIYLQNNGQKLCLECKENKNIESFQKNNRREDNLSAYCKSCLSIKKKISDNKHRETKAARDKKYYELHKEKVLYSRNLYWIKRRKEDPICKLKTCVRSAVLYYLKCNKGMKNGNKTFDKLPYTPTELKEHLEKQFEPWMNWNNHGVGNYKNKKKWNIDHIIPQSKLPYNSLDHINFQKCWSLENLRPLEAIQNIKKGNKV